MSGENTELLLRLLNCMTSMLLTLLWMGKAYEHKYTGRTGIAAAFLISSFAGFGISMLRIPLLNAASTVLSINIISFIFFNYRMRERLIYNQLFFVGMVLTDVLSAAVLMAMDGADYKKVMGDALYASMGSLMSIIFIWIWYIIFVIGFVGKKDIRIKIRELLLQAAYTVFTIFVIIQYTYKVSDSKDGITMLIIAAGFLIIDIVMMKIVEDISASYQSSYELEMMKKQNEMQYRHFKELSINYEKSERLLHDVKKHIQIMDKMGGADGRANEYALALHDDIKKTLSMFVCSSPIFSAVMNQKIDEAEEQHIKVELDVMDIDWSFMRDMDITAIFANLWDNAIEAAANVCDEERHISVTVGRVKGFLNICFENSFDGVLIKDEEGLISTKKNHRGLGMNIIKDTVEKYGGICRTEVHGSIFTVEITIAL